MNGQLRGVGLHVCETRVGQMTALGGRLFRTVGVIWTLYAVFNVQMQ